MWQAEEEEKEWFRDWDEGDRQWQEANSHIIQNDPYHGGKLRQYQIWLRPEKKVHLPSKIYIKLEMRGKA